MEYKEIQMKNLNELIRLATELKVQLRESRFHLATRQAAVTKVRSLRKDLARIETTLNRLRKTS